MSAETYTAWLAATEQRASNHVARGGDLALFWAGEMSTAVGMLESANLQECGAILERAGLARAKYDCIMLESADLEGGERVALAPLSEAGVFSLRDDDDEEGGGA